MKKVMLICMLVLVASLIGCGKKESKEETTVSVTSEEPSSEAETTEVEPSSEEEHPTLPFEETTEVNLEELEIKVDETTQAETVAEVYHEYIWPEEALTLKEYEYWLDDEGDTGFEEGIDNGSNWANNAAIMKYLPMPVPKGYDAVQVLTDFLRANGITDIFVICDMRTMEESDIHYRWNSTYSGGILVTYYNKIDQTYSFELIPN